MTSRTSTEVCDELEKMAAFFDGGFANRRRLPSATSLEIKRLHSDQAGDFNAPYFSRCFANHKSIHHSFTSSYDPQTNGTAERSVGLITFLASRCLCTSGLGSSYWSYSVCYVSQSLLRMYFRWDRTLCPLALVLLLRFVIVTLRPLTGRLLFWDHLRDHISYILCPPEDDVSDPLVYRASLIVKMPPGVSVDGLAGPQPLPAKTTFNKPLAADPALPI